MIPSHRSIHLAVALIVAPGMGYLFAQETTPDQTAVNLSKRITASWQGQELGTVLERIAASTGALIWLDRRVDPQQEVDADFSNVTLAEVLDQLTANHSLSWSAWENLIYVGGKRASELPTLMAIAREKVARLPPRMRGQWLKVEAATWPRLSDPREILQTWLTPAGIKLSGLESLSHDLWAARELPPMPLVDRVVLVLAGFGMLCDISSDGRTCRIVRIEQPVFILREYDAGSRAGRLIDEFRNNSRVTIERRGGKVQLAGRWEDHQRAQEILGVTSTTGQQRRSAPRTAQNVYSLRLENQPVGKVIDQLARQLGLQVIWNAPAKEKDSLVTCEVTNATLSELLTAVLSPARLEFQLEEKRLEIAPSR